MKARIAIMVLLILGTIVLSLGGKRCLSWVETCLRSPFVAVGPAEKAIAAEGCDGGGGGAQALPRERRDPRKIHWHPMVRQTLALIWCVAGFWIGWPLLRKAARGLAPAAIMVLGGLILAGVLVPERIKSALTPSWLLPGKGRAGGRLAAAAAGEIPFRFDLLPQVMDVYKLAHLLLFAAVGCLLVARRPYPTPMRVQVGLVALFALATEVLQVLATGRNGNTGDVVLDLAGAGCGMLLAGIVWRRPPGEGNNSCP